MVTGGIGGYCEPARRPFPESFYKVPSCRWGIDDVSFRGNKRVEPFNAPALLALQNGPDLVEIGVEMSAIGGVGFHVGAITTDDIGVGSILANRQVAPGSSPFMFLPHFRGIEK
jgi:hypothetical protein